jgi:hypothetical protein
LHNVHGNSCTSLVAVIVAADLISLAKYQNTVGSSVSQSVKELKAAKMQTYCKALQYSPWSPQTPLLKFDVTPTDLFPTGDSEGYELYVVSLSKVVVIVRSSEDNRNASNQSENEMGH